MPAVREVKWSELILHTVYTYILILKIRKLKSVGGQSTVDAEAINTVDPGVDQ